MDSNIAFVISVPARGSVHAAYCTPVQQSNKRSKRDLLLTGSKGYLQCPRGRAQEGTNAVQVWQCARSRQGYLLSSSFSCSASHSLKRCLHVTRSLDRRPRHLELVPAGSFVNSNAFRRSTRIQCEGETCGRFIIRSHQQPESNAEGDAETSTPSTDDASSRSSPPVEPGQPLKGRALFDRDIKLLVGFVKDIGAKNPWIADVPHLLKPLVSPPKKSRSQEEPRAKPSAAAKLPDEPRASPEVDPSAGKVVYRRQGRVSPKGARPAAPAQQQAIEGAARKKKKKGGKSGALASSGPPVPEYRSQFFRKAMKLQAKGKRVLLRTDRVIRRAKQDLMFGTQIFLEVAWGTQVVIKALDAAVRATLRIGTNVANALPGGLDGVRKLLIRPPPTTRAIPAAPPPLDGAPTPPPDLEVSGATDSAVGVSPAALVATEVPPHVDTVPALKNDVAVASTDPRGATAWAPVGPADPPMSKVEKPASRSDTRKSSATKIPHRSSTPIRPPDSKRDRRRESLDAAGTSRGAGAPEGKVPDARSAVGAAWTPGKEDVRQAPTPISEIRAAAQSTAVEAAAVMDVAVEVEAADALASKAPIELDPMACRTPSEIAPSTPAESVVAGAVAGASGAVVEPLCVDEAVDVDVESTVLASGAASVTPRAAEPERSIMISATVAEPQVSGTASPEADNAVTMDAEPVITESDAATRVVSPEATRDDVEDDGAQGGVAVGAATQRAEGVAVSSGAEAAEVVIVDTEVPWAEEGEPPTDALSQHSPLVVSLGGSDAGPAPADLSDAPDGLLVTQVGGGEVEVEAAVRVDPQVVTDEEPIQRILDLFPFLSARVAPRRPLRRISPSPPAVQGSSSDEEQAPPTASSSSAIVDNGGVASGADTAREERAVVKNDLLDFVVALLDDDDDGDGPRRGGVLAPAPGQSLLAVPPVLQRQRARQRELVARYFANLFKRGEKTSAADQAIEATGDVAVQPPAIGPAVAGAMASSSRGGAGGSLTETRVEAGGELSAGDGAVVETYATSSGYEVTVWQRILMVLDRIVAWLEELTPRILALARAAWADVQPGVSMGTNSERQSEVGTQVDQLKADLKAFWKDQVLASRKQIKDQLEKLVRLIDADLDGNPDDALDDGDGAAAPEDDLVVGSADHGLEIGEEDDRGELDKNIVEVAELRARLEAIRGHIESVAEELAATRPGDGSARPEDADDTDSAPS